MNFQDLVSQFGTSHPRTWECGDADIILENEIEWLLSLGFYQLPVLSHGEYCYMWEDPRCGPGTYKYTVSVELYQPDDFPFSRDIISADVEHCAPYCRYCSSCEHFEDVVNSKTLREMVTIFIDNIKGMEIEDERRPY